MSRPKITDITDIGENNMRHMSLMSLINTARRERFRYECRNRWLKKTGRNFHRPRRSKITLKCQCPPFDEPFFCSLTGCEMTPHQRTLCKTRLNYREFFQARECDHVAHARKMVNAPETQDSSTVKKQPKPASVSKRKTHKQQPELIPLPTEPCKHRGEQIRNTTCKPCLNMGRKSVEVWACAVHGECTARKGAMNGATAIRACLTCGDYAAEERRQPSEERLSGPQES